MRSMSVAGGLVFGMSMNDVIPPSRAARDSLDMSAFAVMPGSRKCTWASIPPAMMTLPSRLTVSSLEFSLFSFPANASRLTASPLCSVSPCPSAYHILPILSPSMRSAPCRIFSDVAMSAPQRRTCLLFSMFYCTGLNFLHLSFMTPQKASPKIPPLILDVPAFLFTKMIGTSLILNPSL